MKKAARKKKYIVEKVEEEATTVVVMPEEEKTHSHPLRNVFKRRSFQIGAFLLFAIILVLVLVVYNWLANSKQLVLTDGKLNSTQVKELIDEVGEKIMLPPNEIPTIATVTDVEKLANQPFFRNAKNGDKVLIFGSTKEAILYRPSIHKIIAVAPINVASTPTTTPNTQANASDTPSITPTPTKEAEKIKVAVLNSTKTAGLAKKAASLLDKQKFDVISTSDAQGAYTTTSVSVVAKNKNISNNEIESIVATFSKVNVVTSSLPADEAAPAGADIVIIVGSDFEKNY